jgi:hypothetical protein
LFDTRDSLIFTGDKGLAIYVMEENGNIYASKYQEVSVFHHSSLAQGKSVAAAGELTVERGVLKEMSDSSGHYQPTREFTDQAIQVFSETGVNMKDVVPNFIHPPLPSSPKYPRIQ